MKTWLNAKSNFMLRLFIKASQVTIHFWCQFCFFSNLEFVLSIFSSSGSFYFKSPPYLRCLKFRENSEKICRNCYFLQCNGMKGMFKSENIAVKNRTTHCKSKHVSKIVFNSNTLMNLHTFMKNKRLHLLNSRRKKLFQHFFICILYHFNHAICCKMVVNFIKFTQ